MAEDKKETKQSKVVVQVVKELPQQEIRVGADAEGNEYNFVTIEEALTEILNNIREIKKSVA